jgi:uncharacterized protein YdaU (DUF1376 family)
MFYYYKHIKDFNNATRHLTRVERSIYSDAIELYYETEAQLTLDFDKLARVLLVTQDERPALVDVLNDFFEKTETGYKHNRCDEEIAKFHAKASKAKASADARWGVKDSERNANAYRTQCEGNANQQPTTNNQQPILKPKPIRQKKHLADGVVVDHFQEFWQAYPKKVGKSDAEKAFKKANPNIDLVLRALSWQRECEQWQKQGGQFIPNPSTYLNQGRWLDEPNNEQGGSF